MHVFQYCGFGRSNFILLTDPLQNVTQSTVHTSCTGTVQVLQSADLCVPNVAHPESLVLDSAFENILDLSPDDALTFNPWIIQ